MLDLKHHRSNLKKNTFFISLEIWNIFSKRFLTETFTENIQYFQRKNAESFASEFKDEISYRLAFGF